MLLMSFVYKKLRKQKSLSPVSWFRLENIMIKNSVDFYPEAGCDHIRQCWSLTTLYALKATLTLFWRGLF